MDYISPIDFFKKETSNVDANVRTDAMQKVTVIAAIIGPDRTRSDLLPYLLTKATDLDQVLLAIAHKIAKFIPLVGGPDQALSLLPIIEALCDIEEISVRDAIVESACQIIQQIGPNHKSQVQAFFELIKRISTEEAGELFYSRVSCCHMLASLYSILNESDQVTLREIYTRLCKDELPIVRRAASAAFIHIAKVADKGTVCGEFLELLKLLCADESQTIQVNAIESLSHYAAILKNFGCTTTLSADLLLLAKTYSEDPSWKIRQSLSKNFSAFAQCFSKDEVTEEVFTSLVHLVHDPEPEVRSVAILEVLPFVEVVGMNRVMDELLPVAMHIVEDPVVSMRKVLADLCVDISTKKLECEASRKISLSDLIMKIMEDEDPLVRLRVIKKIPIITSEEPDLCTRLTPNFKEMYSSTNWRVRKELNLSMPFIVQNMGEDYFLEHFIEMFLRQLTDGVDEVREAATTAVHQICALGESKHDFVYEKIFPTVQEMARDIFLVRISMVSCLKGLIDIPGLPDHFIKEVLELLIGSCNDKVVNIRIIAAKTLAYIFLLPNMGTYRDKLEPVLEQLRKDKDRDVKFFAC